MRRFQEFVRKRYLRREPASAKEIRSILDVVERDIAQCSDVDLGLDWRFNIAYNAGLQLCKIVLRASGFRTSTRSPAHFVTINCLPEFLGESQKERTDYLDQCRSMRNRAEYDAVGVVSEVEVSELFDEVSSLKQEVLAWLSSSHPELVQ